jgi:molybdopterin converting factor small subunit
MPASASVRVLLFARYADLLGSGEVSVPLPDPPTVAQVIRAVRALPGGKALPEQPLVAVNARQARNSDLVGAGDEVAFLPPMAGG